SDPPEAVRLYCCLKLFCAISFCQSMKFSADGTSQTGLIGVLSLIAAALAAVANCSAFDELMRLAGVCKPQFASTFRFILPALPFLVVIMITPLAPLAP